LIALRISPNPLVLAIATGVMMNLGLAVSALHVIYVNRRLLPRPLRPSWVLEAGLVFCSLFYGAISGVALLQEWPRLQVWLSS
jgi:hypothetical protein